MRIMITGFEPFGDEDINAAMEAVRLLPDAINGAKIIKIELPTVFERSAEVVAQAIEEKRPDAVICVGQAGGRSAITVEKVAINYRNARIPDNAGAKPVDQPILEGGPTAYFSTLPVKTIVERVQGIGIPAAISYSAGAFVCNDVMYRLLHLASTRYPDMLGGFIHVPYTPKQAADKPANTPSMAVRDTADALICAITCVIEAIAGN